MKEGWLTVPDIHDMEHHSMASRAILCVTRQSDYGLSHEYEKHGVGMGSGKINPKRIKPGLLAAESNSGTWAKEQAKEEQQLDTLKQQLLQCDQALPHAEYFKQWADQVKGPSLHNIPHSMRGQCGTYMEPSLRLLPFVQRCIPTQTVYKGRPPAQSPVPGFNPLFVADLLGHELRTKIIPEAVRGLLNNMLEARKQGKDADRKYSTTLAVGQKHLVPKARSRIWDVRWQLPQGGGIKLLDFTADISTHLNRPFIKDKLADFPDQEAVGFLLHGVDFNVDMALQIVMLPHLLSLNAGIFQVEEEIKKLAAPGTQLLTLTASQ